MAGTEVEPAVSPEKGWMVPETAAGFQDPGRGGSDGHDPSPWVLCAFRRVAAGPPSSGPLGVELVLIDALDLDRSEGAQPDVECGVHAADPPLGQAAEDGVGEMETGGGGGDCAWSSQRRGSGTGGRSPGSSRPLRI